MKTFLLVLLILIGVVLAVKLLPFALGLVCVLAGVCALLALVGLSVVAGLACAGLVLALLLSPLWLPLLAIVGVIALVRKLTRKPAGTAP
ncbi:MAG: hypothetical protein HZA93_28645 [Verrucomicrobia bacterium]|nr:hypothetical protein [Verrucomicrobiota bacterium]